VFVYAAGAVILVVVTLSALIALIADWQWCGEVWWGGLVWGVVCCCVVLAGGVLFVLPHTHIHGRLLPTHRARIISTEFFMFFSYFGVGSLAGWLPLLLAAPVWSGSEWTHDCLASVTVL